MRSVCVYCGSTFGATPAYAAAAAEFGAACAQRGLRVIYGGGAVGLMGVMADAVLAAGGEVIGVIPRAMIAGERGHRGLTELIAVDTMHERKQRMADLADAFVALPGGIGTLEEVLEVFTWLQLGLHLKPVGLLDTGGYYAPLLAFLRRMREEGFLTAAHLGMLAVAGAPEALLDLVLAARPVHVFKPFDPVSRPSSSL